MKRTAAIIALFSLFVAEVAYPSPKQALPKGVVADRIVVEKSARRLTLMRNGAVLKRYTIALGRNPIGDKTQGGDDRTPEGVYTIDRRNDRSQYHRALHISYPTPAQIEEARARGVDPGGDIMIHGLPRGLGWMGSLHQLFDWTRGCVAVTNAEIDEIWRVVPDGTTIEIRP